MGASRAVDKLDGTVPAGCQEPIVVRFKPMKGSGKRKDDDHRKQDGRKEPYVEGSIKRRKEEDHRKEENGEGFCAEDGVKQQEDGEGRKGDASKTKPKAGLLVPKNVSHSGKIDRRNRSRSPYSRGGKGQSKETRYGDGLSIGRA